MSKEKYDVVIDTLKEKYDVLWKISKRNMNSGGFNIMDTIRLEQMDHLECAIQCWKKYKHEWIEEEKDDE